MKADEGRILLVEDRFSLREMLAEFLGENGYQVQCTGGVEEALQEFSRGWFHLSLVDLRLPDGSGLDVLKRIRQSHPAHPVILMTAFGTVEDSVQAMKYGAVDFIQKPIQLPLLLSAIQRAIDHRRLQTEALLYREEFRSRKGLPFMISRSPLMEELAKAVQKIAPSDATVLLMGESGTGKELFALSVHSLSNRRRGPFVEINCAAIPETLLENELFGHVRGAYTGADFTTRGKFELADGGTLFLDEVAEIPIGVQSKLLRVIEEKKCLPIGAVQPICTDARIVAATNRDLEAEVRARRFREDLYFRLAQFPIHVPPLRERPEDILPLAEHFARETAARMGKAMDGFTDEAVTALTEQFWPGNVRELKNMMMRAVIVNGDGRLDVADLFPRFSGAASGQCGITLSWEAVRKAGLEEALHAHQDHLERWCLHRAMDETGQDRAAVAQLLRITPKSLQQKWNRQFPKEE